MLEEVLKSLRADLEKATENFKRELQRVRTGRANLALLDPVRVDYYGARVPLNQVASLSVPDARLIVIKPWEKNLLGEIEKAINVADIGVTPQSDGEVVRLPIPALTEDRRKELVKQCRKMAETAKVTLRNLRRDANEALKEQEKEKVISEDEKKRGLERVQKETDQAVTRIDEILAAKEKEILTL